MKNQLTAAAVALILTLVTVAGCGRPDARNGEVEPAREEPRSLKAEIKGLTVSIGQAHTDPAGLFGGVRPDPVGTVSLTSVREGSELTFLEPLLLSMGEDGLPSPFLLSLSSLSERIVDVDFEHRVLDDANQTSHSSDRILAQYDERSGIWFVNLTRLALALERRIDASLLHRFVMFARMESGEVRQFSVSLRMFVPFPRVEVSPLGNPEKVAISKTPGFPIVVHREMLTNPGNQRLRVMLNGSGSAGITYVIQYKTKNKKKFGKPVSSTGALDIEPSVRGPAITYRDEQWIGFDLAPGQSAEVTWTAGRSPGTPMCKLQKITFSHPLVSVYDAKPSVVGTRVSGKFLRTFRIAPSFIPYSAMIEEKELENRAVEIEGEATIHGAVGISPSKAKAKYSCQGVF